MKLLCPECPEDSGELRRTPETSGELRRPPEDSGDSSGTGTSNFATTHNGGNKQALCNLLSPTCKINSLTVWIQWKTP